MQMNKYEWNNPIHINVEKVIYAQCASHIHTHTSKMEVLECDNTPTQEKWIK